MAERRMFAKSIIDSDFFLDMPQSTQLLYFHLSMRADDDGFINNPKSIMRNVKCNEDDLKLLAAKQFIIPFESGIVVIKHWRIHNYIKSDRYKGTIYQEEKSCLSLENNIYAIVGTEVEPERIQDGTKMEPDWNHIGGEMDTQDRVRGRIDKFIDKDTITRVFENILSNVIKYSNGDFKVKLEENGKISFLPYSDRRPANPSDFNIKPKEDDVLTNLVLDGKIMEENLKELGFDKIWLMEMLQKQGIIKTDNIFLATYSPDGNLVTYLTNNTNKN